MSYSVHIEKVDTKTYLVRVYKLDESYENGDKYTWGSVIQKLQPNFLKRLWYKLLGIKIEVIAFFTLMLAAPKAEEASAVIDKLQAEGFTKRRYVRWKNGKKRIVELKL